MTRSQLAQKLTSVHPACRGPHWWPGNLGVVEGTTESRLDDVEVFWVEGTWAQEDQVMKRPGSWEGTHFGWGPLLTSPSGAPGGHTS